MKAVKPKRKQKESKGLVSVFLTIILVPCMVFTCIFGDLSRVQLSMAASESAGDLALYSLMSHYDEELKEYYGLVASCQNIDDFYDITENYFVGMLQAEGVPDEGSTLFVQYLRDLQEKGYSDFLRCEVTEPKISAANNGTLGTNPALIEDGIVEFMKYRGPITIVSNLIDRFSELDLEKQSKEIDENKEVSDAKQEYAEEQGELLKKAFYTYLAIRNYEKMQEEVSCPAGGRYKDLEKYLDDIRDDLKGVTNLVTLRHYPGTESLQDLIMATYTRTGDYEVKKAENVGKEKTDDDGNIKYYMTNDIFDGLLDGLDDDLKAIKEAAEGFVSDAQNIPSQDSDTNLVVYCMKMQKSITDHNLNGVLASEGKDVMEKWAKMEGAQECETDPDDTKLPGDWKEELKTKCDEIQEVYDQYLKGTGSNKYTELMYQYRNAKNATERPVASVQDKSYTFTSKYLSKENVTIGQFFEKVSSDLQTERSALMQQVENLNIAIDGGTLENGNTVVPLDDLVTEAQNFTQKREEWGDVAGRYDTDYAKSERELYENANAVANNSASGDSNKEVEGEVIAAQITKESVTELKNRLVHIRDDAKKCLEALDAFTYGGIKVYEINDADKAIAAAQTQVPENNDYSKKNGNNAARGYAEKLISPLESAGKVYQAPMQDSTAEGNDPNLSKNIPKLYKFLKEKLKDQGDEVENELKNNEDKTKQYNDQATAEKDTAQTVEDPKAANSTLANLGSDLTNCRGNVTDEGKNKAFSLLDGIGSVVSTVNNVLNGTGDELRDQIYVCEYIMEMFSYSSFDTEGMNRLAVEDGQTPVFPYTNQKAKWEKEDTYEVMRNQSLTNIPINKAHDHANLGEVEYILYGKQGIKENLTSAYVDIFAIREAVNTVSGFVNFYPATKNTTAEFIEATAIGVAEITLGIVPVPVTKCVLILALATLESASDLNRLKQGQMVDFYKAKATDWVCSLEQKDKNTAKLNPGTKDKNDTNGMYYSDYMYIFLLIGLTNDGTYPSMLLRVGDLIQANMCLAKGGGSNSGENSGESGTEGTKTASYDLSKAICYYNLTASVRVKPLMMTLPIVDTVEGSADMRERADWCTYKVNLIRGYS